MKLLIVLLVLVSLALPAHAQQCPVGSYPWSINGATGSASALILGRRRPSKGISTNAQPEATLGWTPGVTVSAGAFRAEGTSMTPRRVAQPGRTHGSMTGATRYARGFDAALTFVAEERSTSRPQR
jgi:hypothetical protein